VPQTLRPVECGARVPD